MVQAARLFTPQDQFWFAEVSGDHNPIHMDAQWAARTFPGRPIVHGAHLVLWALDALCARERDVRLEGIQATFIKPLFLNEPVELEDEPARLRLLVRGEQIALVTLIGAQPAVDLPDGAVVWTEGQPPLDHQGADLTGFAGALALSPADARLAAAFPALAAKAPRLPAALAGLSTLVGMTAPGLNSVFSELQVSLEPQSAHPLRFRVTRHDARFSRIEVQVAGLGIRGKVTAFAGGSAATDTDGDPLLDPSDAYVGASPLIIGGASGLGAATARLLRAGGADPVVAGRGLADTASNSGSRYVQFDVASPEAGVAALQDIGWSGGEVYYFASPRIFRRRLEPYQADDLQEFWAVFVDGFYETVRQLLQVRGEKPLSIFYPSSVAVAEPSAELFEYQLAKSAGEQVCRRLVERRRSLGILIARLPRVRTPQTRSFVRVGAEAPEAVMEPIVRRVQAGLNGLEVA